MIVQFDKEFLYVIFATNIQDDSETLEFRTDDPLTQGARLVVGITCYDRHESPLLIHVPGDIRESLLTAVIDYSRTWFTKNMPDTRIVS